MIIELKSDFALQIRFIRLQNKIRARMEDLVNFEIFEQLSGEAEFWKAQCYEQRRRAERAEHELWLARQDLLESRQQVQECEDVFLADVLEEPSNPVETEPVDSGEIPFVEEEDEEQDNVVKEDNDIEVGVIDDDGGDWYRPSLPTIVEEDPESIPGYYDIW